MPDQGGREFAGKIGRHRSHIGRYRHLIIIQDHDQIAFLQMPGVIQRLEGHPRRHGAVADQGDHDIILASMQLPTRHPEGR